MRSLDRRLVRHCRGGRRAGAHRLDPRANIAGIADDHLALGFGRHHCLGYHLAKMEARMAITSIMERWPNLRLDPAAEAPKIIGLAFRSPTALPVLLN